MILVEGCFGVFFAVIWSTLAVTWLPRQAETRQHLGRLGQKGVLLNHLSKYNIILTPPHTHQPVGLSFSPGPHEMKITSAKKAL